MERLTEKLSDGRNVLKKHYSYNESTMFGRFVDGKAVDRLAEYEDLEMYDKNVHFLTRAEAEAALEKMKGEEHE